jgi:tRNA modification GTPase
MSVPVATYATLLTPPGRGAVATVIVAGPLAMTALEHCFQSARQRSLADYAIGEIAFGRWQATGEEVVVARRAAERIEIHCHGGSVAVAAILNSLSKRGCEVIQAAAWLRIDQPDRLVADAIEALAQARTARTASILLDQQAGALRRELQAILAAFDAGDLRLVSARLQVLQSRVNVGRHLIAPYRVVVAGPANVGKSTLVNALLGYQRSIVCDQPGTTRDVLTANTAIDGWPLELTDTAGLRDSPESFHDLVERMGIVRALEQIQLADLVVLVFDLTAPLKWDEMNVLFDDSPGAQQQRPLIVYNKCDLVAAPPADAPAGVLVSARTGAGLPALLEAIAQRLVPEPPAPGVGVPFLSAHFAALDRAQASLAAGNPMLARRAIEELLSGKDSSAC